MGVDSVNPAPSGRPSVRVSSKKSYNHGLVIADIPHMPGGICGVWPAFWMLADPMKYTWPSGGEIDILEGVNNHTDRNQMTLHTDLGCGVVNASFSGTLMTQDCDVNAQNQDKNAGCGISDASPISYGSAFNAAHGGVYALEWTSDAIKIWFFDTNHVPVDITNGGPLPQFWATPSAQFAGLCNIDDHFKDLQIVFDTTFCGAWAGAIWGESECAALAPTCEEYVADNPSAFGEAFWKVNSVKVYEMQADMKVSRIMGRSLM